MSIENEEFGINEKKVRFRYPKMSDLDDLLNYVNSLVEEGTSLYRKKKNKEEGKRWLENYLKKIENNERVQLVVEFDGKVMGSASAERKEGYKEGIIGLGIGLKKEIREKGIGTKLMERILSEAKEKLGAKSVILEVWEGNKAAIKLYISLGFEVIGKIKSGIYYKGKYRDGVRMEKDLR